nr:hypothetical protein Iba_chr06cCG14060 [Ipomoea batatas]
MDDPARQVSLDFVLAIASGFDFMRTSHTRMCPSDDADATKYGYSSSLLFVEGANFGASGEVIDFNGVIRTTRDGDRAGNVDAFDGGETGVGRLGTAGCCCTVACGKNGRALVLTPVAMEIGDTKKSEF